MADKRLYVVTEQLHDGGFKRHLVNALSAAAALRHVVTPRFDVSSAKPMDVASIMSAGGVIEEAWNEPDPTGKVPLPLAHHGEDKNKVKVPK